jgi:amino acid adenylation domain-containing protein
VLKAGKVYVPMAAKYPRARLEYMLRDAGVRLIVTDRTHAEYVASLVDGREVILVDDVLVDGCEAPVNAPVTGDSIASILYTSGSTGEPKGVVNTHRQLLHTGLVYNAMMGLDETDRVSNFMSFAFAGGMKIHVAVLAGGAALVGDRLEHLGNMADFFKREGISVSTLSPSLLKVFLASVSDPAKLERLRIFYIGGEPLHWAQVRRFKELFPDGVTLLNVLAMTEVGSVTQFAADEARESDGSTVPVGYPVADIEVLVVDDDGRQVPAGEVGRIAAKGRHIAQGYWGKRGETRAVFLDADESGRRTYLSGDLGRISDDGGLVHLGRRDLMVKLRSYRIEPSEIESALRNHPLVVDAAVAVRKFKDSDERLVAYMVVSSGKPPTAGELRRFLARQLPDYMMPSVFVEMESLPLTPNGKVDRRALPTPEGKRPTLDNPFIAPRTPVEGWIAGIWAEVLGLDRVGVDDDFFELGGHSLLAARTVSRVTETFRIDVPIQMLFAAPTAAGMAATVTRLLAETAEPDEIAAVLEEIEKPPIIDAAFEERTDGYAGRRRGEGDGQ